MEAAAATTTTSGRTIWPRRVHFRCGRRRRVCGGPITKSSVPATCYSMRTSIDTSLNSYITINSSSNNNNNNYHEKGRSGFEQTPRSQVVCISFALSLSHLIKRSQWPAPLEPKSKSLRSDTAWPSRATVMEPPSLKWDAPPRWGNKSSVQGDNEVDYLQDTATSRCCCCCCCRLAKLLSGHFDRVLVALATFSRTLDPYLGLQIDKIPAGRWTRRLRREPSHNTAT